MAEHTDMAMAWPMHRGCLRRKAVAWKMGRTSISGVPGRAEANTIALRA